MSADNWTHCPRCTDRGMKELVRREEEIVASYGKTSVKDFDAARMRLADDRASFEHREETFREDYEIFGAEDGVVTVSYSGKCMDCGLKLAFQEEHPIPGL